MTKGIAVVARPDSVTHFICPLSPDESVTHHMVPSLNAYNKELRCRYCRHTEAELRKEHEL